MVSTILTDGDGTLVITEVLVCLGIGVGMTLGITDTMVGDTIAHITTDTEDIMVVGTTGTVDTQVTTVMDITTVIMEMVTMADITDGIDQEEHTHNQAIATEVDTIPL